MSETRRDAYRAISPHAPNMREQVFAFIQESGGATCDEVEVALGMRHQTASARLNELANAGRVYASDVRRATRSGMDAAVYMVGVAPPSPQLNLL